MVSIGCIHCKKLRHNFAARTFELIVPIRLVLHRVSSSNKTVPNAPKLYEMHQNMSLGSNGVDRVNSLWKLRHNFVARTFALIAPIRPVLHRVSSSTETVPNAPKHYEMHWNMSLGSNCVDRLRSLWRIPMRLHCTNFCNNCTYSARFAPSFVQ